MSYAAKTSYKKGESDKAYKEDRFSSNYGQYNYKKEIKNVKKILNKIDPNSTILDIPCGNGRWWKLLSKKAKKIIACDISSGMLKFAAHKKNKFKSKITLKKSDAEKLQMFDKSVDYSFCFALTKHLPRNIQFKVLKELNRVSKKGIVCTFPIMNFFTFLIYNLRNKTLKNELKPIFLNDLKKFLRKSKLEIVFIERNSSFLGVEHILFLQNSNFKSK